MEPHPMWRQMLTRPLLVLYIMTRYINHRHPFWLFKITKNIYIQISFFLLLLQIGFLSCAWICTKTLVNEYHFKKRKKGSHLFIQASPHPIFFFRPFSFGTPSLSKWNRKKNKTTKSIKFVIYRLYKKL